MLIVPTDSNFTNFSRYNSKDLCQFVDLFVLMNCSNVQPFLLTVANRDIGFSI